MQLANDDPRRWPSCFISFRHGESSIHAKLIYDSLLATFGRNAIFKSDQWLLPGQNFPAELRKHAESALLMIAIIGPNWRGPRLLWWPRIFDPSDWVRLELELSHRNNRRIVPLLHSGARIPRWLPKSLGFLRQLHTIKTDENSWEKDLITIQELVRESVTRGRSQAPFGSSGTETEPARSAAIENAVPPRPRAGYIWPFSGALGVILLIGVAASVRSQSKPRSNPALAHSMERSVAAPSGHASTPEPLPARSAELAATSPHQPPARVAVESERDQRRVLLDNGAQVHSGEKLNLAIDVVEPLFATLSVVSRDGTLRRLYPTTGSIALRPGVRSRIPSSTQQFFELDTEIGAERLIIFFTTAPLSADLKPTLAWLNGLQRDGDWPVDWPLPRIEVHTAELAKPTSVAAPATGRLQTRGIFVSHARASADRPAALVGLQLLSLDHR